MKKILFVNSVDSQCGVNEYGKNTFRILQKHLTEYELEYSSPQDFYSKYDLVIVNYHPLTTPNFSFYEDTNYLVIQHDYIYNFAKPNMNYIHLDPLFEEKDNHYKVSRFLLNVETSLHYHPNRLGTLGFGTFHKDYHQMCVLVNGFFSNPNEIGEFLIHIPRNTYIDADGVIGDQIINILQSHLNPNIRLFANREYLPIEKLIYLMSQNTLNILLYNKDRQSNGCSSALDLCLNAKRPVAVNNSQMFRQLTSLTDDFCIEKNPLRAMLDLGKPVLDSIYRNWTEENLANEYRRIINVIQI